MARRKNKTKWRDITLCATIDDIPASGPTPADLAEMLIDGDVPTQEDRCHALEFMEALTPYQLKVAFFRSLVRGTSFTKADLARESGISERGVGRALERAAKRAWGGVPK